MKIYKLAHNTIDNKDYDILINFLKKRKYLNQSKVTKLFEKKFSNFLGVKNSAFVNSGSSANLLMAQTLLEGNYLKNKVAVLPSVSWSTTVSPFLQLGYKIILCDCDKENITFKLLNITVKVWEVHTIQKNLELWVWHHLIHFTSVTILQP